MPLTWTSISRNYCTHPLIIKSRSKCKGKGKFYPGTRLEGPEEEQRFSPTLSLTSVVDGCGWSTPHRRCFTPGKETHLPIVHEIGWATESVGRVWNISRSQGFDPPTTYIRGKSISKLQILIEKRRMGIMTYKQHLFFNVISIQI